MKSQGRPVWGQGRVGQQWAPGWARLAVCAVQSGLWGRYRGSWGARAGSGPGHWAAADSAYTQRPERQSPSSLGVWVGKQGWHDGGGGQPRSSPGSLEVAAQATSIPLAAIQDQVQRRGPDTRAGCEMEVAEDSEWLTGDKGPQRSQSQKHGQVPGSLPKQGTLPGAQHRGRGVLRATDAWLGPQG